MSEWSSIVTAKKSAKTEVNIAMVGKYVDLRDAYISLTEALLHGGIKTLTNVKIHYIESQDIEKNGLEVLSEMDGIVVPGGFGDRGIEGKIATVKYARENGIPYLGICLGMQLMADSSSEDSYSHGLGFVKGTVSRFSESSLKVPHMGFNQVEICLLYTSPSPRDS